MSGKLGMRWHHRKFMTTIKISSSIHDELLCVKEAFHVDTFDEAIHKLVLFYYK